MGNLLVLFTLLQQAISNFHAGWVNLTVYLKEFDINVQTNSIATNVAKILIT